MAQLGVVAQLAMDMYYQDYKPENSFLGIEHFQLMCAMAYSNILQAEYKENKLINRSLYGFSFVEISQDLLKSVKVKVEKNKDTDEFEACIPDKLFTFMFDNMSNGVQGVYPLNSDCKEFIKVTMNDLWNLCLLPQNSYSYYYVLDNKIIFKEPKCNLQDKQLKIVYIPAIDPKDENAEIPDTRQSDIVLKAIQLSLSTKEGNIIKKSNDGNPNATLETEVDKGSLKSV